MVVAMRRASSREQVASRAAAGLVLIVDVGESLSTGVADDEAFVALVDLPRWRELARLYRSDWHSNAFNYGSAPVAGFTG
jgi:hypothetical protein